MQQSNRSGDLQRIYVIVRGTVQGVGYRYFVVRTAQKLGVSGWVRNLMDGTVDLEAQGSAVDLDSFVQAIQLHHPWAKVEQIQITNKPIVNISSGFTIEY
jgi:acylphosphatase